MKSCEICNKLQDLKICAPCEKLDQDHRTSKITIKSLAKPCRHCKKPINNGNYFFCSTCHLDLNAEGEVNEYTISSVRRR